MLSVSHAIKIHFHADRVIKLDDGATHTPDLIELNGEFSVLGDLWRYLHSADNTVYFARVVEVENASE